MDILNREHDSFMGTNINWTPLAIFAVVIVVASWLMTFPLDLPGRMLPEVASAEADRTDELFRVLFMLGTVVFLLVQSLLIYASVRYRAKPGDTSDGPAIHGNAALEIIWTAIPSVIVVVLAVLSFIVWNQNVAPSATGNANVVNGEPITIEAQGQRYKWGFTYLTNADDATGEPITINSGSLHVYIPDPQNCDDCEFELQMTTQDVIHSFWVPAMRVKQDLLPGRETEIRFTPIKTEEGFEHVFALGPVDIYSEATTDAEVLGSLEGVADGEIAIPVEFELAQNSTADDLQGDFAEINYRGQTGYLPTDAITGRANKYRLVCTELCGGGHGEMYTWLYVHESEDAFAASWYSPQVNLLFEPPENPVELGRLVLESGKYPCAGCHQLESLEGWNGITGPSLNGLGQRAEARADASGDDNAATYIAEAIRRPNDYIVAGYNANIMPYFGNTDEAPAGVSNYSPMPQEDLNAIVAYLCTQVEGGSADASACDLNGEAEGNNFADDGTLEDVEAAIEYLNGVTDPYQQ